MRHQRDKAGRTTQTTFDTLVRNRYFRQWSFAAQPAGYPDVIRWRAYRNSRDAMEAVRAGQIDIGGRRFIGDTAGLAPLVADLRLHHPERLHAQPTAGKVWEALNTQVPPFDNRLARQAVNYAVDRTRLAADLYGADLTDAELSDAAAQLPGLRAVLPVHPTRAGRLQRAGPRQGAAAGRAVRNARRAGSRLPGDQHPQRPRRAP